MGELRITVESISFRAAEPEFALPLLRGDRPVDEPEWVKGVRSDPAAYVVPRKRSLDVIATFVSSDPTIREASVQAHRIDTLAECIGDVRPGSVRFADGRSEPVCLSMQVTDSDAVALDRVKWRWQFETKDGWQDANCSEHEIAMTLGLPTRPWGVNPSPPDTVLPWWEALAKACSIARGQTSAANAVTALARALNATWGGSFYVWQDGVTSFATAPSTKEAAVDLRRFLRMIDGGPSPRVLDCNDLAAVLSTFGALFGAELTQFAFHEELLCKPVRLVGHTNWQHRKVFGIHEVVLQGAPGSAATVWDACLEVSGDRSIRAAKRPAVPRLPTRIREREYMDRLLVDSEGTLLGHQHTKPRVRPVRSLPKQESQPELTVYERQVEKRYSLDKNLPPVSLLPIPGLKVTETVGSDWEFVREPEITTDLIRHESLIVISRTLWYPKRPVENPAALVALDVYLCPDPLSARQQLVSLVARFALTELRHLPSSVQTPSLNVALETRDGQSRLMTWQNVVFFVRPAGAAGAVGPGLTRQMFAAVSRSIAQQAPI